MGRFSKSDDQESADNDGAEVFDFWQHERVQFPMYFA